LADVDYGQAIKAGADSGISVMVGELDDAFGSKKQLSVTNRKKASQATGLINDAADATPRPRTNALSDVEVAPSRGTVKNAASGLADAGAGTGNVGRKTGTALSKDKLKNAKKSSPSISKNQQKMQSQTINNLCFTAKVQKNINEAISIIGNNTNKIKNITKTDIINSIDGVTETSTQIANQIRKKKIGINILSDEMFNKDVDYGQAIKAGADFGISAMVGELDDAFGSKRQLSATNRKKASQATGLSDDAADATPRPRTNALPDVEVTPSRGAVKNAAGGLADAGVGIGNVSGKTGTALSKDKLKNTKKSSPSLSKNQHKFWGRQHCARCKTKRIL